MGTALKWTHTHTETDKICKYEMNRNKFLEIVKVTPWTENDLRFVSELLGEYE